MDRRDALKSMGMGVSAAALGLGAKEAKLAETYARSTRGLPDLTITNVKAIATQPDGIELVVVKVETSEPGLYGLGCATFRQRAHTVVSAVDDYLHDLCVGRSVNNIEDLWQTVYQSSYWRNGPVLNNALSGLDQALWDIKGKRANMPLYELFGGKVRFAVPTYTHAGAGSIEELIERVQEFMGMGYRHVRIQLGGYGGPAAGGEPDFKRHGFGMERDNYMDRAAYVRSVPMMFEAVREACGEDVELLHDVHSRVQPMDAIRICKEVEPYRPFFIEDPLSPENIGWFEMLREQTHTPIAMGELFNSPHEWVEPMANRWYDFIRIHVSQIGGVTPALKVARLGEFFNVKTAWHGPGDVSPVGHACNVHISLAVWNLGILEMGRTVSEPMLEVFPGAPFSGDGYAHINEEPGHGVDLDEAAAVKYPIRDVQLNEWTQLRAMDGTPIRP